MVATQLPFWTLNCDALVPVLLKLVMVRPACALVLVTVTVRGALVVLLVTFPNVREVGDRV